MTNPPETRPSLLLRIRRVDDAAAWSQFLEIYAPLVYGFLRRRGVQDADAADLTQEVLCSVARTARSFEYDVGRGSFRSWLLTITRNRLRNYLTRRDRAAQGSGRTDVHALLHNQPAGDEEEAAWEREWQRRQFTWASEQVRPTVEENTWQAFWRTAIECARPADVARQLGMTVANVYRAKSRVTARLKEHLQALEES